MYTSLNITSQKKICPDVSHMEPADPKFFILWSLSAVITQRR